MYHLLSRILGAGAKGEEETRAEPGGAGAPPEAWTLELLQELDWKLFEKICAAYLKSKCWEVKTTTIDQDDGIDIYFNSANWNKASPFGIVQCKGRHHGCASVHVVREFHEILVAASAEIGIFINTGSYTRSAIEYAAGKKIVLIDGEQFLALIHGLDPAVQQELLERHIDGDYSVPTCARCGTKMERLSALKGEGIGRSGYRCANYPSCSYTLSCR